MKLQMSAAEAKALLKAQVNGELPDERGRFGPFGGRYVPETLVEAFNRLEQGVARWLTVEGPIHRQVYVPAGEFLMGSTNADQNAEDDEKPQRSVYLDAFYISQVDLFEASGQAAYYRRHRLTEHCFDR